MIYEYGECDENQQFANCDKAKIPIRIHDMSERRIQIGIQRHSHSISLTESSY